MTRQKAPASGVRTGLALVEDARAALEQGRVGDVRVPDHPADVRRRPEDIAGVHPVDRVHGVVKRDGMSAVVAQDALGFAGRAGCVQDVEGVGGVNGHGVGRGARGLPLDPVEVPPGSEFGGRLRALQDHAVVRLVGRERERFLQERLVRNHAVELDAAGRGEHELRRRVVDAYGEFARGESPEDHRVHGAEARAGEHRHDGFRHHRHVDDHPVALADAEAGEPAGHPGYPVGQFRVGELRDLAGRRRVVDEGDGVAPSGRDVAVECKPRGVELAAPEPAPRAVVVPVQDRAGELEPVDGPRLLAPEVLRRIQRTPVLLGVPLHSVGVLIPARTGGRRVTPEADAGRRRERSGP